MEILILASLLLAIVDLVVKPILNLVLLPLNLITLGAFRWIINVIVIYLVTLLIPEFKVKPFIFPGLQLYGFVIPLLHFNLFWTYILISFILSLVSNLTYSLFK
jgi:putative membrane protein